MTRLLNGFKQTCLFFSRYRLVHEGFAYSNNPTNILGEGTDGNQTLHLAVANGHYQNLRSAHQGTNMAEPGMCENSVKVKDIDIFGYILICPSLLLVLKYLMTIPNSRWYFIIC